jgi:hypothetical protein
MRANENLAINDGNIYLPVTLPISMPILATEMCLFDDVNV